MVSAQGKNWCFTLNNWTAEEYEAIIAWSCKYLVVGKETGSNGTMHLQGFVSLHVNHRLTAVKRLQSRAHWELARGTSLENFTYCSKDGDFVETGTRPLTREEQRLSQKERWTDVIRAAKEGSAEAEYPREFVQYNSCLTRLFRANVTTIDSYSGLWFFGRPGTGKSRTARDEFPGLYDKLINKWWDGYVDEETVLVDDLGTDHQFMGSFLKRWADHYPFRAEFKGGSKIIRPARIIVTSNYKISEIWTDRELVAALERRFTLKEF